jgi:hypothetical protein
VVLIGEKWGSIFYLLSEPFTAVLFEYVASRLEATKVQSSAQRCLRVVWRVLPTHYDIFTPRNRLIGSAGFDKRDNVKVPLDFRTAERSVFVRKNIFMNHVSLLYHRLSREFEM